MLLLFGLAHFGNSHAQSRRDGIGGVPCRKSVIGALLGIRETAQSALFAQSIEIFAATGENLVCVCLMTHVPH